MVRLDPEIKMLESFGKRAYTHELNAQRTIINDLLAGMSSSTCSLSLMFKLSDLDIPPCLYISHDVSFPLIVLSRCGTSCIYLHLYGDVFGVYVAISPARPIHFLYLLPLFFAPDVLNFTPLQPPIQRSALTV